MADGATTSRSDTTRLFELWSNTYDRPSLQRSTYRPIHDAVLRALDGMSPAGVLDLGCGTGQLTSRLVDAFPDADIVGLDLSAGMLAEADERLDASTSEQTSLLLGDAERLPFAARSFDVLVCTESFHWYPNQDRALAEMARVLRRNGRLLIASIATVTGVGDRLLRRASSIGGPTIRALPPGDLKRLVEAADFDVIHQRRVPRPGPLAWPVLTEARRR